MRLPYILSILSILEMALALPVAETTVGRANGHVSTFQAAAASSNSSESQVAAMQRVAAYYQAASMRPLAADLPIDENDLSGPCKAVTVIFAKGTGEKGNVGDGSSPGPRWFEEMRKSLGAGSVSVQGVPYDAEVIGYLLGGDPKGSQTYLDMVNQAATQCPDTKLVLGGYSQGAQLAHNAAGKFSEAVTDRVTAAVMYGDPFQSRDIGSIPNSKVLKICHDGDIICSGSGGADAHLTYSRDAADAAAFVAARE